MRYAIRTTPFGVSLPFYWFRGEQTTCYLGYARFFSSSSSAVRVCRRLSATFGDDIFLAVVEVGIDDYGLPVDLSEIVESLHALASGSRRAKTAQRVSGAASQSGPKGNAQ